MDERTPRSMAELQETDYGTGRDYTYGSPHLVHPHLRRTIERDLMSLVTGRIATNGDCHVLEVGAGHGTFTQTLVDAGGSVTVTEMSEPSAEVLKRRFAGNNAVRVLYDPTGDSSTDLAKPAYDCLVLISVLHHIPDYVKVLRALLDGVKPGGAFYCTQDPLWYPDRGRFDLFVDRGSYFAWRLAQGDIQRGLATRLRRARGIFDEDEASDMVEFHVVRKGVNQKRLVALLEDLFLQVELRRYWSTQSRVLQKYGDRRGWKSTFSITATGRLG